MNTKKLFVCLITVIIAAHSFSQAPNYFQYQTIIRDKSGNILANEDITLQVDILKGSESGERVYKEGHNVTTNAFGLVNLEIGNGDVIISGFNEIEWGDDIYYLTILINYNDGTAYSEYSTSQFLSVPYAMYANKAGGAKQYIFADGVERIGDTIVNTEKDKILILVPDTLTTNTHITGSYPNFTISADDYTDELNELYNTIYDDSIALTQLINSYYDTLILDLDSIANDINYLKVIQKFDTIIVKDSLTNRINYISSSLDTTEISLNNYIDNKYIDLLDSINSKMLSLNNEMDAEINAVLTKLSTDSLFFNIWKFQESRNRYQDLLDEFYILTNVCWDPRDNQRYETMKIGNKIWMTKNLNYPTSGSHCYNSNPANCETYGRLYSGDALDDVCPPGWRVPSDQEWIALEQHFDDAFDPYTAGCRGIIRTYIEAGTEFNALKGGYTNILIPPPNDIELNTTGYFWTSDVTSDERYIRSFSNSSSGLCRNTLTEFYYSCSVRCIRNNY